MASVSSGCINEWDYFTLSCSVLSCFFQIQSDVPVLWRTKREREISIRVQPVRFGDEGHGEFCFGPLIKPGSANKPFNLLQVQVTSFPDSSHLSGLLLVAFVTLPYEVGTRALSMTMIPSVSHPFFYWPSVFKRWGCKSFSRTNKRVWAAVTAGAEASR